MSDPDLYNWLLAVMTTLGINMTINLGMWISSKFWTLTENYKLVYDGMKITQVILAAALMILSVAIGLERNTIPIY